MEMHPQVDVLASQEKLESWSLWPHDGLNQSAYASLIQSSAPSLKLKLP